jgi:transcriptional regulator with XRE-family HTH domain
MEKAEALWAYMSGCGKFDGLLPVDVLEIKIPKCPPEGWFKANREALLITKQDMADRLSMSLQGYVKLENSEASSKASLESLQKVAEAMDCELVYFIRPRKKKPYSKIIWEQILPKAAQLYKFRFRSKPVKAMVFARIALRLLRDPSFRREMGWGRNRNGTNHEI